MAFALTDSLDTATNGYYATILYGYDAKKFKKLKVQLNIIYIG